MSRLAAFRHARAALIHCHMCGQDLPREAYYTSKRGTTLEQYVSPCKACHSVRSKAKWAQAKASNGH